MSTVMVRYTVKPELVAENERLVRAVYAELEGARPEGLRYATFKLADGIGFMHVAAIEAGDGANPLLEVAAFREFTEDVATRCTEQPVTSALQAIGSYRTLP
jgi:hypothetical protein